MPDATDPRYPIGKIDLPVRATPATRAKAIAAISALPNQLHDAVRGFTADQLDTPYRAGGWRVRQVVHHIADSHVNAYVRHKLTITEVDPPVKAYDENAWANLVDAVGPIGNSLLLVQAIHDRWATCLRSLPEAAFARTCVHSANGKMTLDDLVALYAWHGAHHVAHITTLRAAKGW
ncbi:MAG: putative metal-dependent hydrolase [Planctomycetes bacterium]|nr:putative metal-dependent hydrolase [Planctomycetota bacterium]